MRRTALIPALLGALGLPAAASAAPAAAPALGVRVASCTVGATAAQRGADFSAAMPATAGATVLTARFDLEARKGTGAWKPVVSPSFGRYERSAPGAAGFVYSKRVERLAAGASYRVTVRFRWLDADGETVKRAVRQSGACRQPDLRPDLAVTALTPGAPVGDGRARYVAQIRNVGAGAVPGPVRVVLLVDGLPAASALLQALAPDATGTVAFEAPVCTAGGTVTAVADPGDLLDEPREADDALTVSCPPPGRPAAGTGG